MAETKDASLVDHVVNHKIVCSSKRNAPHILCLTVIE